MTDARTYMLEDGPRHCNEQRDAEPRTGEATKRLIIFRPRRNGRHEPDKHSRAAKRQPGAGDAVDERHRHPRSDPIDGGMWRYGAGAFGDHVCLLPLLQHTVNPDTLCICVKAGYCVGMDADPPRLTRPESMEMTRQRLLEAAWSVFVERGYEAATIERISAKAGFTRGAFYAHFPSKPMIYLEVFRNGAGNLAPPLLAEVEAASCTEDVIAVLVGWADRRLFAQDLGYLMMEVLQHARRHSIDMTAAMAPVRDLWRQLGEALARFFPDGRLPASAESIGAVVIQLAQSPLIEGPVALARVRHWSWLSARSFR